MSNWSGAISFSVLAAFLSASASDAHGQTNSLTFDGGSEDWPRYVCLLSGREPSADNARVQMPLPAQEEFTAWFDVDEDKEAQRVRMRPDAPFEPNLPQEKPHTKGEKPADRDPELKKEAKRIFSKVRELLAKAPEPRSCDERSAACSPWLYFPRKKTGQNAWWVTCAENTIMTSGPPRVMILAVTAEQETAVATTSRFLRGNLLEFGVQIGGSPNEEVWIQVVGGHYQPGYSLRAQGARLVLGLRPICIVRTTFLPDVAGAVGRTHSLRLSVRSSDALELDCVADWRSPLRIAFPATGARNWAAQLHLRRRQSGGRKRFTNTLHKDQIDAEWRAQWEQEPPPELSWRPTFFSFAWSPRREYPFSVAERCPKVTLPNAGIRCDSGATRSRADNDLIQRLGHPDGEYCFYRCPLEGVDRAARAPENRFPIEASFPTESAWIARDEYGREVATWREPLLRPLQILEGYADPSTRKIIVDLDLWRKKKEEQHPYCTAEINIADAADSQSHLRPYDKERTVQQWNPLVVMPHATEGATVTWRVLGCRKHDLGQVSVTRGSVPLTPPDETVINDEWGWLGLFVSPFFYRGGGPEGAVALQWAPAWWPSPAVKLRAPVSLGLGISAAPSALFSVGFVGMYDNFLELSGHRTILGLGPIARLSRPLAGGDWVFEVMGRLAIEHRFASWGAFEVAIDLGMIVSPATPTSALSLGPQFFF